MPGDYSSDSPLEFPTSPNSEIDAEDEEIDDNENWPASHIRGCNDDETWPADHVVHVSESEDDADGPTGVSDGDGPARPPPWIPIMEEQEVGAESETDMSIRAEARKAHKKAKAAEKARAAAGVLRIRLPGKAPQDPGTAGTAGKTRRTSDEARKRVRGQSRGAAESEGEDSDDAKPKKKQRALDGTGNKAANIHSDTDEEPVVPVEQTVPPKRRRGRPPGSGKARIEPPLPPPVPVVRLNASVFVEMSVPPKLVPGRTPKGDKHVAQKPRQRGPFTLTKTMSWARFLVEVSQMAEIDQENLDVGEMTWSFQKPKVELSLTGEDGFRTMIQQALALKDPSSVIIIVYLPTPKQSKRGRRRVCDDSEAEEELREVDDTRWGKKARLCKTKRRQIILTFRVSQLSLDEQLAPIVVKLEEMYPIGQCRLHPDISCFHSRLNDWHFNLNSNRVKVWANAILRKVTDYTRPPLGSNFFLPKDKIDNSPAQPAQSPQSGSPPGPPWAYGPPPSTFFPYQQSMVPFSSPSIPWGYPHTPNAGYAHVPPPYTYNSPIAGSVAPPPPFHHTGLIRAPFMSLAPGPSSVSLTRPPAIDFVEWCAAHNLGDAERQGLQKLGFVPGETDSLVALPTEMWEWAGLGPLHRQRILNVCSN